MVAELLLSQGVNFWARCASGNVFIAVSIYGTPLMKTTMDQDESYQSLSRVLLESYQSLTRVLLELLTKIVQGCKHCILHICTNWGVSDLDIDQEETASYVFDAKITIAQNNETASYALQVMQTEIWGSRNAKKSKVYFSKVHHQHHY